MDWREVVLTGLTLSIKRSIFSSRLSIRYSIFLLCLEGPCSASAPPLLYTQCCPRRWQKEQVGFSPGHLDFLRLQGSQA